MTAHTTPYDAEITRLLAVAKEAGPGHTADTVFRALNLGLPKQEGYLRALADMQPRIDALVAALQKFGRHPTECYADPGYDRILGGRGGQPGRECTCGLTAALKLAGKE